MKLKLRFLIYLYALAVLVYVGILLYGVYQSRQNSDDLRQLAEQTGLDNTQSNSSQMTNGETSAIGENTTSPASTTEPTQKVLRVLPSLQKLFLENQDLVGWIKIEGTPVDYPVMYTPFQGDYYLYRNFEKKDSKYGLPFVDPGSRIYPRSTNILIHGHHMRDGSMFATLAKYQSESFYKNHKRVQFDTVVEAGEYEIFAAFLVDVGNISDQDFVYYKFVQADTAQEFDDYVQNALAQSLFDTGIKPEFGDQLLTLSTCSYQVEEGRMVVVARKTIDQNDRGAVAW